MAKTERKTEVIDVRRLFRKGLGALLLWTPALALADLGLTLLTLPAAGSDGAGVIHLLVDVLRLHAVFGVFALVPAVGLALFVRALPSSLRARVTPLDVSSFALAAVCTAAAGLVYEITEQTQVVEFAGFSEALRFVTSGSLGALALGLFFGARVLLRRGAIRMPVLGTPRFVAGGLAALVMWLVLVLSHFVAAPVYQVMPTFVVGMTGTAIVLALSLCWGRAASFRRAVLAGGLLFALVVSWPLSNNAHARFVLFGHVPLAGAYGVVWRGATDLDGDGVSSTLFGGNDCAEGDPLVSPLSAEIPGDGIDQDCRGGDAQHGVILQRPRLIPHCDEVLRGRLRAILLITIDALRADHVSPRLTPALFEIADHPHTSAYLRAYPPSGSTAASMLSIQTGRWLFDLNPGGFQAESLSIPSTTTEVLAKHGLETGVFNAFDLHPRLVSGATTRQYSDLDESSLQAKERLLARATYATLSDFVRSASQEERKFAWAHIPDLHAPYPRDLLPNSELSGFEQGLAYVDSATGAFFARLQEMGALDETLVIISADHGEQLGERGREGHGTLFFEEGVRVPLLIHAPGCARVVSDDPVSLVVIRELIERLVSDAPPPPRVKGQPTPVVVEEGELSMLGLKRAVIGPRYKIIDDLMNGGRMAFDLQEDPFETVNIAGRQAPGLMELEARYQAWLDAEVR